jgi:hypothetical protein
VDRRPQHSQSLRRVSSSQAVARAGYHRGTQLRLDTACSLFPVLPSTGVSIRQGRRSWAEVVTLWDSASRGYAKKIYNSTRPSACLIRCITYSHTNPTLALTGADPISLNQTRRAKAAKQIWMRQNTEGRIKPFRTFLPRGSRRCRKSEQQPPQTRRQGSAKEESYNRY